MDALYIKTSATLIGRNIEIAIIPIQLGRLHSYVPVLRLALPDLTGLPLFLTKRRKSDVKNSFLPKLKSPRGYE